MIELSDLYAAYEAAAKARGSALFGSPAYIAAAKECAQIIEEAQELTGEAKPFVKLVAARSNFHPPKGTGRLKPWSAA